LVLDQTARRYGTRPSTLLRIRDPWQALDLDMAITARARAEQRAQIAEVLDKADEESGGLGAFCDALLTLLSS
jgi:hypothetical protein